MTIGREPSEPQQEDWRQEFEEEVIRRSSQSDAELLRSKSKYEPPRHAVQEAMERDEHMVTSREILDLLKLQAHVNLKEPKLQPQFEELRDRVLEKLKWTLDKMIGEEKELVDVFLPVYDPHEYASKGLVGSLEELRRDIEVAHPDQRMMLLNKAVNAMHVLGSLARHLIRDFKTLKDEEIKEFFDRLNQY